MFELPETKRVRRSDLRSPSFSPPPGTIPSCSIPPDAAQQKLHSLLSSLLPLDGLSPSSSTPPPPSTEASPPEDEYDFPLFTTAPTTTITLRTPTPPPTTEGLYLTSYNFLASTQCRPDSYYFFRPPPTLSSCAFSGEDILLHARRDKWLGSTYPWRLITVTASPPLTKKITTSKSKPTTTTEGRKKCKPGKKRRIYLRQALAKKQVERVRMEEMRRAERERKEKEEEEKRVKRMARNRERKVKKRVREKAKKLAAGGGGAVKGGESAGESGGEEAGLGEKMDIDR